MVNVRENTIEEFEEKLESMATPLNKINYLESALKESGNSFEAKKFLWETLSGFYTERKMFERAAKAISNKAAIEVSFRDRSEDYLVAAELYTRVGKIEDSEEMFTRASREGDDPMKMKIKLARKNIYFVAAKILEDKGKRASAVKFYEKLIKMKLEDIEKVELKGKLLKTYKALGMFREARLLEGK